MLLIRSLTALCGVFSIFGSFAWATQGVTDQEIRVGTHTALSGPAAAWGLGSVRAIRFHFDEINAQGGVHGRKLRLIAEDHQYQVVRARQAANKLIRNDQVFVMLSALGTSMNNVAWPLQAQYEVPNLFPYTSARSMSEPLHRLKFTASVSYFAQASATVRYFQRQGYERFCLMHQNTDYGREALEGVEAELQSQGLSLTAVAAHSPTETNFLNTLLRLRAQQCEVLLLGTILGDTIRILKTRHQLQWKLPTVGNVSAYDQLIVEQAGEAAEDFYATASIEMLYADALPTPESKRFFASYRQQHGESPNNAVQMAYFYARIFTHALRQVGPTLTTAALVQSLESMNHYRDPLGGPTLQFGPNDHAGIEAPLLAQIRNGRWITVTSTLP